MKEKDANVDRIAALTGTTPGPAQRGTECQVRTPKKTAAPKPKGKPCRWCDREAHPRNMCPSKNSSCNIYKKKGHFVRLCKSSTTLNSLVHEHDGFGGTAASPLPPKWNIEVIADETQVVFRLDTDGDETVVPLSSFRSSSKSAASSPSQDIHFMTKTENPSKSWDQLGCN